MYVVIDYIAIPKDSGVRDYIGAFAVSAGFGSEELCRFFSMKEHRYLEIPFQFGQIHKCRFFSMMELKYVEIPFSIL